eukprot:TRINITY_DN4871_c0_g1_i2.p2 TRINITY_DN4871_c0_g1~~TRINITY_DN4871_c0_g1_i2.p2  ORF type:complete len:102 (-),score=3.84 TRINITY_DN4871_c0_g1_i2:357-662(-)
MRLRLGDQHVGGRGRKSTKDGTANVVEAVDQRQIADGGADAPVVNVLAYEAGVGVNAQVRGDLDVKVPRPHLGLPRQDVGDDAGAAQMHPCRGLGSERVFN